MVQLVPASFGRTSATVTFRATPAPLLLTAMVNPMGSPAETGEASAVLVISMEAQLTVTESWPVLSPSVDPSLVAAAEAVLVMVEQLCAVVGEVMWTWVEAPAARMAGPYTR